MNKRLFLMLCDNYNKEINNDLYELFKKNLEDYNEEQIENAIKEIIKKDKYMPTLARIIEMIDTSYKPEWMDKEIVREEITPEELAELEEEFKIFEN